MPSPTPILATKLYMPPLRPEVVSRPRLLERLNEGLRRHLVLISAPAGFGKTTLVSQWLALIERPAAWLSLDEGDNDPARFLTYLVAALQTIAAHVGEGVLGVLQSPQPPPTEAILTTLLNDLTSISDQFVAPGHRHPRGSTAAVGPLTRRWPHDGSARRRFAVYSL